MDGPISEGGNGRVLPLNDSGFAVCCDWAQLRVQLFLESCHTIILCAIVRERFSTLHLKSHLLCSPLREPSTLNGVE